MYITLNTALPKKICLGNSNLDENEGTAIATENKVMNYITFTTIVGAETIKKFEALHGIVPEDIYEEFFNLYKIWKWFGTRNNSSEQNVPGTGNKCFRGISNRIPK